jgi:hypothetical protein
LKQIELSGSFAKALVDDDDFEQINQKRWRVNSGGYAYASFQHPTRRRFRPGKGSDKQPCLVLMHRLLLGLEFDKGIGIEGDHLNGNRLDNQRKNLRAVTRAENQQNRLPNRPRRRRASSKQSPYRGVHFDPSTGLWKATVRGRHLGLFVSDVDAHLAAQAARLRLMPFSEHDRSGRL